LAANGALKWISKFFLNFLNGLQFENTSLWPSGLIYLMVYLLFLLLPQCEKLMQKKKLATRASVKITAQKSGYLFFSIGLKLPRIVLFAKEAAQFCLKEEHVMGPKLAKSSAVFD